MLKTIFNCVRSSLVSKKIDKSNILVFGCDIPFHHIDLASPKGGTHIKKNTNIPLN